MAARLAEELGRHVHDGTVYLGYPVLAAADDRVAVDALLVSPSRGLVAFLLHEAEPGAAEWEGVVAEQDRLYAVLDGYLTRHDKLRRGRRLGVTIETVTVFPGQVSPPDGVDGRYIAFGDIPDLIPEFEPLDVALAPDLFAALERVTSIKPAKKRARVERDDSRGAVLKVLERQIANLDQFQKQAAIESPDGPQRIRGLAGSGKTVVLALKAAYLHTQHPTWRIGVTFFSRALYQQFLDLTTRFCFETTGDAPDFERLQVMHCWGASGQNGVYRTLSGVLDAPFRDWRYASATWGRQNAFRGACDELLTIANVSDAPPIFDAVVIDEAQDLPPEFFRLIHRFTHDPKRIVWAYDELQNLSESVMPATDELFGLDPNGEPLVTVENTDDEARRDIILPICYRNPPWTLAAAHAIGFGIYSEAGLVQHFDNISLWQDIGYRKVSGALQAGRTVTLERSQQSYPDFIPELLDPVDSLKVKAFGREAEQDEWVAKQIAKNLTEDELDHDDIVIVLPDAVTSRKRAGRISRALSRHNIASHLVGVGSGVDEFWVNESISISHIFRAKGNEAPMVYALDAQDAVNRVGAITHRNTLFTAITRSRAWVRVCGWGPAMPELVKEFDEVRAKDFRLTFTVPTAEQRAKLRRIHRERSAEETAALRRTTDELNRIVDQIDREELDIEDLPSSTRRRLRELLLADDDDDA
jgi:superfamily I DNA and RNA helicase